jgi:hypothetical protein
MKARLKVTAAVMPAGEYWVGDPCYSVPDDKWMTWLQDARYELEPDILLAEIDGLPVLGITTAHGDGKYRSNQGDSFPVDAGMIGLTPKALVEGVPFGSKLVTFERTFECSYDEDDEGLITLGLIEIKTDPEADEDDWDDEDDFDGYDDEEEAA